MPAIVAVGLAFGATASTAAVVGTAVIATGVSVAATGYSAYAANKASKSAAAVDNSVAGYNARYDEAMAAQLDLDTQANIRTEREQNAVYLSKQHASYAAAGVIANSGSALDAQLTNVGRMEQQLQQQWVDANQKMQSYASSASVGRLEGQAQAEADRAQGKIALINGGAKIASSLFSAYGSGVFSGLGSSVAPAAAGGGSYYLGG